MRAWSPPMASALAGRAISVMSAGGGRSVIATPSWGDPAVLSLQAALNRAMVISIRCCQRPAGSGMGTVPPSSTTGMIAGRSCCSRCLRSTARADQLVTSATIGVTALNEINEMISAALCDNLCWGICTISLLTPIVSEYYLTVAKASRSCRTRSTSTRPAPDQVRATRSSIWVSGNARRSVWKRRELEAPRRCIASSISPIGRRAAHYSTFHPCEMPASNSTLAEKFPGRSYRGSPLPTNIRGYCQTLALCREQDLPGKPPGGRLQFAEPAPARTVELWGRVIPPASVGSVQHGGSLQAPARSTSTILDPSFAIVASMGRHGAAFAGVICHLVLGAEQPATEQPSPAPQSDPVYQWPC